MYTVGYPWLSSREKNNRDYVSENLVRLRCKYLGTISIFEESQPTSLEVNLMFKSIVASGNIRKIINYEEFKKDKVLHSEIMAAKGRSKLEYDWHQGVETLIEDLISQIRVEVKAEH
jgi:hypothetical protein